MEDDLISPQGPASLLEFDTDALTPYDQEIAIPLTPRYKTHKKLEVISARQINLISAVYHIVSFVALLASTAVTILARTTFSEKFGGFDFFPELTLYSFPPYFALIDSILSFMVFAFSIAVFLTYSIIIFRESKKGKELLHEQLWVLMLLLAAVVYFIPYEAAVRLRVDFLAQSAPRTDSLISFAFIGTKVASFSVLSILYLWFGSHSYRYLERRVSIRDIRFYLPKIISVVTYVVYKLCILFIYQVTFSELPFASLVAFLNLYGSLGEWPRIGVISVLILTIIELGLLGTIAVDTFRTHRSLQQAEYRKHRTKMLGFRFFLHQHVVFYTIYTLTFVVLLFGLPNGIQIFQLLLLSIDENGTKNPSDGRGSYFDVQYSPFGLLLCVLGFTTVEAYTNLPANISLRTSIFPCISTVEVASEKEPEPVVYRNTEPLSFSEKKEREIDLRPSCFVMQTNVELFNFAWFVYYHGTKKETNMNIDFKALNLTLRDFLYDKDTDTRVIIAEGHDRIILAFKGTSSTQNIVTDINVRLLSLSHLFDDENLESDLSNVPLNVHKASRTFRRAKIHAGFAAAYGTVQQGLRKVTRALLQEKTRPIFLTGHSLGGALATLSSLDLLLSENIPGHRLLVSTFGSPKVGNNAFQELYDYLIPTHWRVVAGGDLISRIPKIGYRHVGRKVYLSASGDLFIDPSALETIFWHSQSASIVHHRKACYLLALKAWCDSLEDNYVPKFWPFPVSQNDSRKFDSTFRRPNSQVLTPRTFRRRQRANRAAHLRGFADAIDALEDNTEYSSTSLALWTNLTSKLLHRDSTTHALET